MNPQELEAMEQMLDNLKAQVTMSKEAESRKTAMVQVSFTFDEGAVQGTMPKATANAIAQWVQMFNN